MAFLFGLSGLLERNGQRMGLERFCFLAEPVRVALLSKLNEAVGKCSEWPRSMLEISQAGGGGEEGRGPGEGDERAALSAEQLSPARKRIVSVLWNLLRIRALYKSAVPLIRGLRDAVAGAGAGAIFDGAGLTGDVGPPQQSGGEEGAIGAGLPDADDDFLTTTALKQLDKDDDWLFTPLLAPLTQSFNHHFRREESPLARLDKPDWAFRYFLDCATVHLRQLLGWMEVHVLVGESTQPGTTAASAASDQLRWTTLFRPDVSKHFLHHFLRQTVVSLFRSAYPKLLDDPALFSNLINELGVFIPRFRKTLTHKKSPTHGRTTQGAITFASSPGGHDGLTQQGSLVDDSVVRSLIFDELVRDLSENVAVAPDMNARQSQGLGGFDDEPVGLLEFWIDLDAGNFSSKMRDIMEAFVESAVVEERTAVMEEGSAGIAVLLGNASAFGGGSEAGGKKDQCRPTTTTVDEHEK